jgi:hypothetical protein
VKFRLLIDYDVIEFLESLSRGTGLQLRNRLVAIGEDPSAYSDYTEPDETGRAVDIHICGKFAVKYWVDHADKHVKVLEVHLADSPRR